MSSIVELVATITGKIDGFRSAMSSGAAATEDFSKAWLKAGSAVANAAANISTAVGTVAGSIVGYAAKMGFAFNSMKEDALTDFTVMLSSAEKAKDMLEDIQSFAAKTPLETTDITQAAKTLLNFGVVGESVMPMLKRLGDASGGNSERFRQMALAYGQISSTGRLMGQDLLQLINAGFNPLESIGKRTGETMVQLKKRMEDGKISIDEVNQAFIDATSQGGRFFGLMEAKSQTASGLMSSLRDNIKAAAGRIFEPLSGAFKQVLQVMTSSSSGDSLSVWVEKMRAEVGRLTSELVKLLSAHGDSAIKSIGDAAIWAAKGMTELVQWFRQSSPAIIKATSEWLAFLKPVGQWIASNPKLVAGLIAAGAAFKTLQILGVVAAFTSLIGTIGTTIALLAKIPALITAITTAAIAAKAPMMAMMATPVGATILVTLALIAAAFAKVAIEARNANREADRLESLRAEGEDRRQNKVLNYRGASSDETRSVLKNELEMSKKNLTGVEGQIKAAGKSDSQVDDREYREMQTRKQELESFIAKLEERLTEAAKPAGETMGDAVAAQMQVAAPKVGAAIADQTAIDKALATHRNDGMEAQYHGYDKIRDFMGMGASSEKVQQFAGGMKGVDPAMAEQLAKLYAASDKSVESLDALALAFSKDVKAAADFEKRCDVAGDKVEAFSENLLDMQNVVPDEEIKGFAYQFEQLSNQFRAGEIDADAYRDSLKNLDNRMKDAKQSGVAVTGLGESMDEHASQLGKHEFGANQTKGLSESTAANAAKKFDSIHAEAERLAESFNAGKMSAAQFAIEMTRLKRATDDVTEAAIKEEQEKRKQALLRGDFAGAGRDLGKAVQDKFASRQMQMFDNAVENIVDQFLPLGQITQTVSDGFQSLEGGMTKFGNSLNDSAAKKGEAGGSGADPQAQSFYMSWLNSIQGQIATMLNTIQFYKEDLEFVTDPQRRQDLIRAIDGLNANIAKLNNAVSTFNGHRSNDPIFRDPGITGGGSQMSIHNNINIPNVYAFTQSEIDHLAKSISNTFSRQGHPAFS